MKRKEIKREIAVLKQRLERNADDMDVDNLKQLEHSPVVQNHLVLLVGGALAGGFAAGALSRRFKIPFGALLPYALKL